MGCGDFGMLSCDDECFAQRIASACEKERKRATASGESQIFEVCLPFNGKLYSQGGYVNYEPGTPPPDGVYGKVIIANGCIVGLEKADLPLYTSSPCAPVPVPCDCEGGGGSGVLPDPSVLSGNLFKYDAAGRPLVRLTVNAGDNISITGSGTAEDPLVIGCTLESQGSLIVRSGNNAISIVGEGSADNPIVVTHKTSPIGIQTFGGMSFDEFGHLVDYTKPTASTTVNGVIGNNGITATTEPANGIVTVSLAQPLHSAKGEYQFGGYIIEVDENNIIYRVQRDINFTGGIYRAGLIDFTINDFGSITDATPLPSTTVTNNATKRVMAGSAISMQFVTDKVASFHIIYTGTSLPTSGIACTVDGMTVANGILSATRYEWLTTAMYDAGRHTVAITGTTVAGFLNVALTVSV